MKHFEITWKPLALTVSLAVFSTLGACGTLDGFGDRQQVSPKVMEEIANTFEQDPGEAVPFHDTGTLTFFASKRRTINTCGPARPNPDGTKTTICCKWIVDENGKITGTCKKITKLRFR